MAFDGTAEYDREDASRLPPLVAAAVDEARAAGFALSSLPAQGRLLSALAAGAGAGLIGETGTGTGVGTAWLASTMAPDARLVTVERDGGRVASACRVFAGDSRVQVVHGDWRELRAYAPFDLLVLDGGGQGKHGEEPVRPAEWLRPGGTVVIDDFTPASEWPPRFDGEIDTARVHWLEHPDLLATEVRVHPDCATILATRRP